ncbi:hypothetical protein [Deinococcus navajonensis]|uniref:SMI1/KNR4 family protein n=1 Tax=Deinococcus navajonensis TaxID=309884 RepID=A0ABV8XHK2_9DEIO
MINPPLEQVVTQLKVLTQQHGLAKDVSSADEVQLLQLRQNVSLPAVWAEMYRLFSPRGFLISPPGNDQALYGATELEDAQVGYGGDTWPAGWIVVGGEGEYPLIIDTTSPEDTGVYLAQLEVVGMQKKRTILGWKARQLSATLIGFLEGLSTYIHQYYSADGPPFFVPENVRLEQYRAVLSTWRMQPDLEAHIPVWQSWLGIEHDAQTSS